VIFGGALPIDLRDELSCVQSSKSYSRIEIPAVAAIRWMRSISVRKPALGGLSENMKGVTPMAKPSMTVNQAGARSAERHAGAAREGALDLGAAANTSSQSAFSRHRASSI
jgi:hypothetical protein